MVLTSVGPIIQMLVILIARHKHVVNHSMVEDKVGLSIEAIRPHVGVDGPVLCLVGLKGMAGPTHGRFALEVNIVSNGLKPLVDLSDKVAHGKVLYVLHGIDTCTIEVVLFHPPQSVGDELFRSIPIFPIQIGHV